MAITVKEAQTLFVSYFGRPADFEGLKYWTGNKTIVGSLEQLAHSFFNSVEGQKYYPVDPATNQINIVESINAIYANMFGRVPETTGFDYWYNEIASGKINLAEAAVAIYKGAQGQDALMIENKIAAATQFTDQVAASNKPSLYYGDKAFAKATEFLNSVTDATDVTSAGFAAQVSAAVADVEAAGAVAGEVGTFMLTPNIDVATAHTFNANPVMSSTGDTRWDTLNSGDKLTGDGVGSVLNIITVDEAQGAGGGSQTTNILPTITNVETLNANVYHGLEINSQYVTGMKNVNLLEATDSFAMNGTDSKLENVTVSNLENNVNTINATFQVNSTYLTGDADALNLAISNVVQGGAGISTIDVTSTSNLGTYETLNIASNGAKTNQIFLKSNSANLGVSGGAVEIDASDANLLATVDATASAGNVKLYNVNATSVKLGNGDDIISINNFNAKTTIDTGAGADLVAIKNTTEITAEKLNNISNAETIRLSGRDATIDFDKLTNGVKNFEVASDATGAAAGSFTFDNVAAGSTFKVITNDWLGFSNPNGTASYNPVDSYGATVAALNLNGTKGAATSVTLTNTNAPGNLRALGTDSNDLSLVSTGKNANTITTLTAGSGSATAPATVAIKISGDQGLTVINNLAGNANVKNFNVDATALTGNLEIHGSNATGSGDLAHSDIIKGGAGNDTISTGIQFHGTAGVNGKAASITFKPTISATTDVFGVGENVTFTIQTATGTTTTYKATVATGDGFVGQNVTVAELVKFIKTATETTTGAKLTDNYSVVISGNNDHITFTQLSGKEVALNGTATTGFNFTTTVATATAGTAVVPGNATTYEPGITAQPEIDGSYDVLTGGAGADKFIFDGSYTDVNARTGANSEKVVTSEITDFKSGEDKLVFMSANANNAGNATNFVTGKVYNTFEAMFNAAIAEFKATTDAAGNAKAGDTQYFVGQFGQDTYVFNDGNITAGAANEGAFYDVVKLTGVALSGIAASDIVAA